MDTNVVQRYCPGGHKFQTKPEFKPCCPQARQNPKDRTHCPQSHEYTKENTYWHQRQRYCKECRRQRNRSRRRAKGLLQRTQIRRFIKARDRDRCRYCGGRGSEVDHVIPRCNNGDDSAFDNLVWSCRRCNSVKGRESGFTIQNERLYWHHRLVAPGQLFGVALLREIEAQREERQLAQGLTNLVQFKRQKRHERGGASHD